tara:strand:+ start:241 stop:603 length:363 start_codon:yes stop_codon:yes gene_type:complete
MVTGAVNPRFAHLPRELGSFASRLPAMNAAVNLSLVDSVMDALINADVTPEGGTAIVDAFNAGLGGGGGGTKRKAGDAGVGSKGPARGAPLTAASQRPPERDVFRMRQAIRPRTDQAEFS